MPRLNSHTVRAPTLVAATWGRGSRKVPIARTFPFLRHLLRSSRVTDASTAESISADNVRRHLQPAGYTTHNSLAGGEERNANKSRSHSFTSLPYASSVQRGVCEKLPCGRQRSIWRRGEAWSRSRSRSAAGLRRTGTERVSTDGLGRISRMRNICSRSDFVDHVCRGLRANRAQLVITHQRQLVDPRLCETK